MYFFSSKMYDRGTVPFFCTNNMSDGGVALLHEQNTKYLLVLDTRLRLNPSGAPKPLPILIPSNFVPKKGFQL